MVAIDTHCHLNFPEAFPNPGDALTRAAENGVIACIAVGCDAESSQRAVRLADEYKQVFAIVGYHPNYAASFGADAIGEIRELIQHPKVVAIGEVGLDYHWNYATPKQQRECTLAHLELAAELGMPVVFHCRNAWDDLLDWLESDAPKPANMIFHCFSGDRSHAQRALDLGGYIGVDGPITYKKAENLRAIISEVPKDRILVETDSPYLTPHPYRSKPNEPALLPLILRALGEVLGVSTEEAARQTSENAKRAFPRLRACVDSGEEG